ncbi:hypothetical protein [Puia sp.]|jgi:hypothetical protein|uniref:hypothetical protein n=1 Tax=Puia sp. TaxID=2045100 RepID=UPI002F415C9B
MSKKTGWLLLTVAVFAVLAYTIQRDRRYEENLSSDLRNRVVGARLIKDGRSPYYYRWAPGDPIRYYNPFDFNFFKMSAVTASPFFHHLLSPLADWPQARISPLWLGIEYILFISAWIMHVHAGQLYICMPFGAMLFLFCFRNDRHIGFAFASGTCAAFLVLIRVNMILFFIPFLFLVRFYTRRRILAFFLPVVLLTAWTLGNSHERRLWQDYRSQVSDWIEMCRGGQTLGLYQLNSGDPHYETWEGLHTREGVPLPPTLDTFYSENGSVFRLAKSAFHHQIPLAALAIAATGIIIVSICIFYFLNRPLQQEDIDRIAILGFCLYMLSDLFSPIHRYQYYTVQWIFPLLLAASSFQPRRKVLYGLLVTGLLLNCMYLHFFKMENTLGEYLMMAVLLVLSTFPDRFFPRKSTAASLS